MRVPLVLAVFIATASTAHAECLSSAEAVWAAHPGSHAMWRLRMPGHIGEKCWYAPSKSEEMQTDAPRNVGSEIAPVSAITIPRPRPRLQDTLAETERAPLPPLAKPASAGEARSILMWGAPMRIDATWDELFAGRERRAE
jgi:hypothetical protein